MRPPAQKFKHEVAEFITGSSGSRSVRNSPDEGVPGSLNAVFVDIAANQDNKVFILGRCLLIGQNFWRLDVVPDGLQQEATDGGRDHPLDPDDAVTPRKKQSR